MGKSYDEMKEELRAEGYAERPTHCDGCGCGLSELQEEHCYLQLICRACKNTWVIKCGLAKKTGNLNDSIIYRQGLGPHI